VILLPLEMRGSPTPPTTYPTAASGHNRSMPLRKPIAQHIGCLIRALRHWRDVRWLLDISGSRANLVALDAPLRKLEPGREAWLPVVCRGAAGDLLKGGRVDPDPAEPGH
jgi:hypothetical protein